MSESLEALLQKRKELNEAIRVAKKELVVVTDRVKVAKNQRAGRGLKVSIISDFTECGYLRDSYVQIILGNDVESVIKKIEKLISELQEALVLLKAQSESEEE